MNRAWKIFLPFAVSLLALNRTFSRLPVIKTQTLELLGESHGPIPVLPRTMSGCATVLASWHRLGFETVKSEDGSGVYFEQQVGDDLYPAPPLAPLMFDDPTLEKQTELWKIELQMQDGTTQTIQQDFEPLFSIGATVVVDGDHVRLWE